MMRSFPDVHLAAVTAALPANGLDMGDFANRFGAKEARRIADSTGIEAVREAGTLATSDLCEAAARRLLEETARRPEDIDAVVVVTQTPDDLMPGVATELHGRLGLRLECLAFDINYGCSGFIYGLIQAASLIASSAADTVLVCTGDVTSKLLDPGDRTVRMVFGDAGTASIVTRGQGQMDALMRTDGSGRDCLRTPLVYRQQSDVVAEVGHLKMAGNEVMNFALSQVPKLIDDLLQDCGLAREEIDLLVLHQANRFMLQYLRRIIKLPIDRVPVHLAEVGNTGPSSIPLLLARHGGLRDVAKRNTLLCGFGVGLSWEAVRLDFSQTVLIPPIDIDAAEIPAAASLAAE